MNEIPNVVGRKVHVVVILNLIGTVTNQTKNSIILDGAKKRHKIKTSIIYELEVLK